MALALGVLIGAAVGCQGPGPGWTPDPTRTADYSPDGLAPVEYSGFEAAWLRPGEQFDGYGTLLIAPPTVQYESPPTDRELSLRLAGQYPTEPNFELSESQMADFGRYLVESFREELGRSRSFRLVDAPEDDTLVLVPAILDLIMLAPLGSLPGGELVVTTSPAEMTLVVDLVDAQSRTVLARVAERRKATPPGSDGISTAFNSTPTDNVAALRNTFRSWARTLRYRLDGTRAQAQRAAAR